MPATRVVAVFHGNSHEAQELADAVTNNCPGKGVCNGCGAHRAMFDQRFCDGVLFARWMRDELWRQELSRKRRQDRADSLVSAQEIPASSV